MRNERQDWQILAAGFINAYIEGMDRGPVFLCTLQAAACCLLSVSATHAQESVTPRRCTVNSASVEQGRPPQEQLHRLKVIVDDVRFDGAVHLPNEILEQLIASIKQREFEIVSSGRRKGQEAPATNVPPRQRQLKKVIAGKPVLSGDADWIRYVEASTMDAWQEQGYFTAHTSAESQVLSQDFTSQHVSVTVHVDEGLQYRLGKTEFRSARDPASGAELFSPEELREQIPLREGDVFNVWKIREGLEALQRLYNSKGYIDFTTSSTTSVDQAQQTISIVFELDTQKQFRVGTIELLGLDPTLERVLRSQIRPGDIFNPMLIDSFYKTNKFALPPDAAPRDTEIRRNLKDSTVDIKLDFRPCLPPRD